MASSDVSMQEMSEVVIVTIPESVDLPSVVEEDKAVLVTTELSPQAGYRLHAAHGCTRKTVWSPTETDDCIKI